MLAGPSLVTCFDSDDGMGVCLRGKMVDAGILPQPSLAVAEPAAVPPPPSAVEPEVAAEPEAAPADTDVALGDPALDVTPRAETPAPAPDNLIAATFGLLRAEPDGSMVIAGSGTPGSEVEVYSNDTLLGKAKVEASGDWVLVPDAPIPPGGTELTLAEAGKEGRAGESFVVVINDDKSSEPLVVASTPGHASEILQGLERPAAGTTTEVATAEPAASAVEAPTNPAPAPTASPATATPTPAPAPDAVQPPTEVKPAAPAAETSAVTPAAPTPVVPDAAAAQPAPAVTAPAPAVTAPAAKPDAAVATAQPPATTPAKPEPTVLANVPPTIDAIEIEGKNTFFAGGGPDGAVMRLYVDGSYIADAKVTDGRWLVEAGDVLSKPSQRIRIDMLKPGSADVIARAEVNFDVALPTEKPVEVAVAEPSKPTPPPAEKPPVADPAPPAKPPVAAPAATTPKPSATSTPPAAPVVPPAATDKPAPLEPAGTVTPPVAAGDRPVAITDKPVTPAVAKPADQPEAPVAATSNPEAVPQPAAEPDAVEMGEAPAAAVETPAAAAEPAAADAGEVPTLVAVAVGDPELARFASGKAIIRRGDNLWTIARRVYGAGIRYTTIYEANNGQISNPNRIFPGQVFDLPKPAQ